ncbi:MAG: hypothetical protein WBY53_19270 [Acidobacteriaceae bacterium]
MTNAPAKSGYSATPLVRKLGVLTAHGGVGDVSLVGEPEGFRELLGELPPSVRLRSRMQPSTNLALCFVRSRAELDAMIDLIDAQLPRTAHVWIVHPKAHCKPDFNQNDVRERGLARGLVDYKVCAVDAGWSGLKFAWRKA